MYCVMHNDAIVIIDAGVSFPESELMGVDYVLPDFTFLKENEELRKKIKEQKKILRKKIETVRRNAFITRKPEEIEKAEKTIRDILTKYNLTEDMLKDDEE